MSPNIPFEIQVEIIKHLPAKSLLRFRTVSKSWKSFIDSPNFISSYPNQSHHLLIAYQITPSQSNYISIADDNTFPQNKLSATLPPLIHDSILVGFSHGLICFCICDQNPLHFVLWNPSIRKSIPIPLATVDCETRTALGFGVCPVTKVPKLVIIDNNINANVFSLSSGVWRISSANLPNKSVRFHCRHSQVTVDRFVYWFGTETNSDDGDIDDDEDGDVKRNLAISFDLSSEVFEVIHLPDSLAAYESRNYLFKRNNSLAVVKSCGGNETRVFEVWVMENRDSKAFTKVFTVNIPYESACMSSLPMGFNRNGDILMAIIEVSVSKGEESSKVVVCKPSLECIEDVGIEIEGEWESLELYSYTESLLLLDL